MNNNLQTLQSILQAMMTISTRGNDTITMANCLQTLNQVIEDMSKQAVEPKPEPVTPEIVD